MYILSSQYIHVLCFYLQVLVYKSLWIVQALKHVAYIKIYSCVRWYMTLFGTCPLPGIPYRNHNISRIGYFHLSWKGGWEGIFHFAVNFLLFPTDKI